MLVVCATKEEVPTVRPVWGSDGDCLSLLGLDWKEFASYLWVCAVVETNDAKIRNKSPHIFSIDSNMQHLFKVTLLIFGELILCVQPLTTLYVMVLSGAPCHSNQWCIEATEEEIMTSGCLTLLKRVERAGFSNTWINCVLKFRFVVSI